MGRILSIDYGAKRTGIAVSDPMKIIATGLTTVETRLLMPFLREYFSGEQVDEVIIGLPLNHDGSDTHATPLVRKFSDAFRRQFPAIPLHQVDERFTSRIAAREMHEMGLKRKKRRDKSLLDEITATMMLQEYMKQRGK